MKISKSVQTILAFALAGLVIFWFTRSMDENRILRGVVERLSADSRVAQVIVTKTELSEETGKVLTTIKFLEFDWQGKPLEPKYFTFEGNLIQFQALVVRFQDKFARMGDRLRGKSAYVFLKAFVLGELKSQVFEIAPVNEIPAGYKIPGEHSNFEKKLWEEFWSYALDPDSRDQAGVKNAQIEAPGSLFLPGTIYTIRIEHDGGLRIDTQPVPEILKGESVR